MTFPNDDTGQVLADMQQAGVDLSQRHLVVFFQLFEQQSQAQAMAAHLCERFADLPFSIHPDEAPNVWDLDCTFEMVPTYEAIVAKERELEKIAASFDGYNDGWGIEA